MNSEQYSQCTLGIFLAITDVYTTNQPNTPEKIFVLDVEGTDSPERQRHGDEGQSFEKRVSLFALAVSEVLLVNVWAKDINRYQASNYSLLKTVFEMNLQLFYQETNQSKTMLLFVLRDYDGSIGKDKMHEQVQKHVQLIWEGCSKPKGKEKVQVLDLFDVKIEFLPHKVFQPEKFETSVEDMRGRLFDKKSDEFIFKSLYHKKVPMAGFEVYTRNIWKQILENRDLNIPAQKEILARFRCNEISDEIMTEFEAKLKQWHNKSSNENQIIPEFGNESKTFVDGLISLFEDQAALYVPQVVEESANQLREKMKKDLYTIFLSQMTIVRRNFENQFRTKVQSTIDQKSDKLLGDFSGTLSTLNRETTSEFKKEAAKFSFPDSNWDMEAILRDLSSSIQQMTLEFREKQLEAQLHKQRHQLATKVDQYLQANRKQGLLYNPKDTFWMELRNHLDEIVHETQDEIDSVLDTYDCTDDEKEEFLQQIKSHTIQHARKVVSDYAKFIPSHMMKVFESQFPPTNLANSTEKLLMEHFNMARDESLQLLDIFFKFRHNDEDVVVSIDFPPYEEGKRTAIQYPEDLAEDDLLISEDDAKNIFVDFSHEIQLKLVHAKHERERQRSSMTSVPWWIYVALLVLGWNELMYVIRSPWILLLLLVGGVFFGWAKIKTTVEDYMVNGSNPSIRFALTMVCENLPPGWIQMPGKPATPSAEKLKPE